MYKASYQKKSLINDANNDPLSVNGFQKWYTPIDSGKIEKQIFLVDFKPIFFEDSSIIKNNNITESETDNEYDNYINFENDEQDYYNSQNPDNSNKEISGLMLFFLINEETSVYRKCRSYIRFDPYFYLAIRQNLTKDQISRLIYEVQQIGGKLIKDVEVINLFDSEDLLFPEKKTFIRVTTYVPSSVPIIRDKLENIPNVLEWREADILFHRRGAIDLNLRVSKWYEAEFNNYECIKLQEIKEKVIIPPIKVFAYDIETNNSRREQPDPSRHNISMISCYSNTASFVLVNSSIVDCSNVTNFFVVTKKPDEDHDTDWIDYVPIKQKNLALHDLLTNPLFLQIQESIKQSNRAPADNIQKISSLLEKLCPLKHLNIVKMFLPQLMHNNPGIYQFIQYLSDFIDTQNEIENNHQISNFIPMNALSCPNEQIMIQKFLDILESEQPDIIADFNGDKFDLPFIQGRSLALNVLFKDITGFEFKPKIGIKEKQITKWLQQIDTVISYGVFHLDAYLWTLRYSYLPKGRQGLKAAVEEKLNLKPIGRESLWQLVGEGNNNTSNEEDYTNSSTDTDYLNNEEEQENKGNLTEPFATMMGNSAEAVAYSGSDAYVTWLYTTNIIVDFVFAMGKLFPVNSSEILTVNAGTLDDLLIDSIGHHNEIVGKKKYKQGGIGYLTDNLNVESVTYTGGYVDSPNPGVWRRDLPYSFPINHDRIKNMLELIPDLLTKIEQDRLKKAKKTVLLEKIRPFFSNNDEYFEFDNINSSLNYKELFSKVLERFPDYKDKLENIFLECDNIELVNIEENHKNVTNIFKDLLTPKKTYLGKVVHLDVTSMYPSQIRQYKLQPSGIVDREFCRNCKVREKEEKAPDLPICAFESPWTAKAILHKPCEYKEITSDKKYPNGICSLKKERRIAIKTTISKKQEDGYIGCDFDLGSEPECPYYSMGKLKDIKAHEFYKKNPDGRIHAYILEQDNFKEIPLEKTYFARGLQSIKSNEDLSTIILTTLNMWIKSAVKGAEINFMGSFPLLVETKSGKTLEWDGFLELDVSHKNSSLSISLTNRFCQKAYDHVAAIMDSFFQLRVYHKKETKRLKYIIKEKLKHNEVPAIELESKAKFHDSAQLGLKVPLNSIYGLLGMKGGVHNASIPSAGVTTSLSVRLIKWAANYLNGIGLITELDTDGIYLFIPDDIPTHYTIKIGKRKIKPINNTSKQESSNEEERIEYDIVSEDSINFLEEILNHKVKETHSNKHYWSNNGVEIKKTGIRTLLGFEQDGPYDFQYVQGKKKYIIYNRTKDGKWEEKGLTGLEIKRRDFSKLHKSFQELIIQTFLEDYNKTESLKKLYQKAVKNAEKYITSIRNGEFDDSYFIVPKTINNPLDAYKAKGPDVTTGLILRDDFGYVIEPGTTVEFFHIIPVRDQKNGNDLVVIPKLFFEQELNKCLQFLKQRGIGYHINIKSLDDIRKYIFRIDYEKYIEELMSQGKIFTRMVENVASYQNIDLNKANSQSLDSFFHDLGSNNFQKKNNQKPIEEIQTTTSSIISMNSSADNNTLNDNTLNDNKKMLNTFISNLPIKDIKIEQNGFTDQKSEKQKEKTLFNVLPGMNTLSLLTNNVNSSSLKSYLIDFRVNAKQSMNTNIYHCPICNNNFSPHECLCAFICPICHVELECALIK